jgi:hypothetical protein
MFGSLKDQQCVYCTQIDLGPGESMETLDERLIRALQGPEPSVIDELIQRREAKKIAHERAKAERAMRLRSAAAGPTFVANRDLLTMEDRLRLRKEALSMGRRATFQMGRWVSHIWLISIFFSPPLFSWVKVRSQVQGSHYLCFCRSQQCCLWAS